MSSLAQKLKGMFGHGQPATVSSSAPIRNTRGKKYKSTAPDEWSEQDPMAFGTLRYPEDLGTLEYGHYLMFHIWQVKQSIYAGPQTYKRWKPTKKRGINRQILHRDYYEKQEHNLFSPDIAYEQDDEKLLTVHRDNKNVSVSGSLRRDESKGGAGRLKRTSDTISLYMPPNLKVSYGANYAKSETGVAGVFGADFIGSSTWTDMFNRIATEEMGNTVLSQLKDMLLIRGITKVSDFVSGGDLQGISRKAAQQALNPALEAIFKSVDLRTFEFAFRFTPKSEDELKQVDAIIKLFKFHMLPERVQGENRGRHLIFPSEFDIQYMYQETENHWYPFVSGCVLEKMDVTYGPGGETQHFRPSTPHIGGEAPAPTEINMTLGFVETEIMTKEKISEGY
jgi:hypothetical protein